jgi:hypothetical protein
MGIEAPADDTATTNGTAATEKPKRTIKRKPIWVAIPTAFEAVLDENADPALDEPVQKPTSWALHECAGGEGQKDAIRALLTKYNIDPTNFHHIRMFRGEVKFKASSQVIIRF